MIWLLAIPVPFLQIPAHFIELLLFCYYYYSSLYVLYFFQIYKSQIFSASFLAYLLIFLNITIDEQIFIFNFISKIPGSILYEEVSESQEKEWLVHKIIFLLFLDPKFDMDPQFFYAMNYYHYTLSF